MPIYEYLCSECEEIFSILQNITAVEIDAKCPKCGSSNIKKMISAFSCCSTGLGGGTSFSPSAGGFGGG
ncbi:MAG: zinc ribbon domain-containing protein [Nitrospirae bacterium]|nr:zinc ribbon domain-containing protein [Nitrospirota bacterium]